ncbi:unannotated protein [freshwater metagenome]|uniref:Unannotated protein n=1 Tax=freshwater metagenome TaxID=449393 RepID=A0A6J7HWH4_9ZZZZ|nr:hypothetical protein [Actinomycetota bacterium]
MSGANQARETIRAFWNVMFQERDPQRAHDELLGATYTQHNPDVPDGKEGFITLFPQMLAALPDFSSEIKRIVVEGDHAVVHHHFRMTADPADLGSACVDIFRFDTDGRIVEHWDVIQPVPAEAANGNTMF